MKLTDQQNKTLSVSDSLEYLAMTDSLVGTLSGLLDGISFRIKIAESQGYLGATGTQDERKSKARTQPLYKQLTEEYEDTKIELDTIRSKRKTAELTIDVWRTQQANKRQGGM